jgi:sugar transferase (PEP-CTERM/EpsH1 system associated)
MRVMYVVHHLDIGGTERLVVDMARTMRAQHDIETSVCCLDKLGTWGEDLRLEGIPTHCVDRQPGLDLKAAWRLSRVLRRQRVDVMHCHQYPAFFYGAIASLFAPATKVIFTEHGRAYPDHVSSKRAWANRWVLRRWTDAITSVSHTVKRCLVELERFPDERIEVIPNGIEPQRYIAAADAGATQRAALGIGRDELVVGIVGRLDPVKDHVTLLHAFARVYHEMPHARLFIVGDGETRCELEALTQSLQLTPAVRFLGFRSDVPALLPAFDVFCLSSRMESLPVAVLEAMATGLPVVATAVGDVPRVVEDGVTGRLCPPGDVEQLAESLRILLLRPRWRQRMGAAGRERVQQHFTRERMLERYKDVYRRVSQ